MAGAGRKWAIGCGIGCGMLVLALGGAGTCAYFGVKKVTEQAEGLEAGFEEIEATYGEPRDYVPAVDGTVAPDRLEAFLAIRDDMGPARDKLSGMLGTLDGDANFIAKAQAGMKLIPSVMGFIGERNRVMLEHGMGVGEYQHIYAVAYYTLLQKDPGDGPGFVLADEHDSNDDDGVRIDWGSDDEEETREKRVRLVRTHVNELQRQILANQLQAFQDGLPAGVDPGEDPWGAALADEVAAMSAESLRFPWEEGLPAQLAASLAPFRDRLAASYDPMTSIIEIGLGFED